MCAAVVSSNILIFFIASFLLVSSLMNVFLKFNCIVLTPLNLFLRGSGFFPFPVAAVAGVP